MVESVSLKEFGYNFCGPLLHSYLSKVVASLDEDTKKIYCLAREGYILQKGLEIISPQLETHYLYASRTFLFRILLSDKASWPLSLGHGYEGSTRDFFIARFGFTLEQVNQIIPEDELDNEIVVPDDMPKLEKLIKANLEIIKSLVEPTKKAYLDYLASVNLTKETANKAVLLDVGYSGTIQKLLSLLLNSDTNGFYFITTDSSKTTAGHFKANMNFAFKDKVKMGGGYTMLDRSMFMESLFTSPDGQFIDILESPFKEGDFIFSFGKRNFTQHHFEKLSLVFDGALEAVTHFHKSNVTFKVEEIEFLYEQYVSKRNLLPSASWPLFEFDDAISGFGNVNSMQFFGL
ncbi:hypothetical protein [Alteromonas lipolytica]|uniref:HAD family hydrolase n=1 Tax=Alteromonas lipolytica TaxID=1856405 RepID=A0A1E8FFT4_9ALTE|nr:hypothetical protein [Alteromonas lipolytica]OFI34458.1 hypothetical protein BFC17_17635 [Alteromonas lipolytica]GGF84689.1 hypothetical protein GCM10011338_41310 [Alteromonas lipolytica]